MVYFAQRRMASTFLPSIKTVISSDQIISPLSYSLIAVVVSAISVTKSMTSLLIWRSWRKPSSSGWTPTSGWKITIDGSEVPSLIPVSVQRCALFELFSLRAGFFSIYFSQKPLANRGPWTENPSILKMPQSFFAGVLENSYNLEFFCMRFWKNSKFCDLCARKKAGFLPVILPCIKGIFPLELWNP